MIRRFAAMLAITVLSSTAAYADGEAFIGVVDNKESGWGRDLAIKNALQNRLGFQTVRLNADTTPAELPKRMQQFLERTGGTGDRRLVWISGPAAGPDSPCPGNETQLIQPATAALLLVPACVAEFIRLPTNAMHVTMRDMPAHQPPLVADHTGDVAPTVVVTLPSDDTATLVAANAIVLAAIQEGAVSPAEILQRLRFGLRQDGSGYTPSIDAEPASAAWSRRFLALGNAATNAAKHTGGTPSMNHSPLLPLKWPRHGHLAIYTSDEATAAPALWLPGNTSVSLLRRNGDGSLGYVQSSNGLFGWVKIDDVD